MFAVMESSGSGTSITIESIGNITSGSGSSSKTVNFKTGTYARDDYASLTIDNFLIMPHRTTSGSISASFDNGSTIKNVATGTMTCYSHKTPSYNSSNGVLTFYGGVYYTTANAGGTTQYTASASGNYDIYIIKPGLSQVVS